MGSVVEKGAGTTVNRPAAACRPRMDRSTATRRRSPDRVTPRPRRDSVSVELLAQLAALLGLQRERGGGAREQPRDADRLAGLFAVAVFALVDAGKRLLHLLQQLAFAIARPQFQRVFFLDRGAVGGVGHDDGFPQVLGRFVRVAEDVALHLAQALPEELKLRLVH